MISSADDLFFVEKANARFDYSRQPYPNAPSPKRYNGIDLVYLYETLGEIQQAISSIDAFPNEIGRLPKINAFTKFPVPVGNFWYPAALELSPAGQTFAGRVIKDRTYLSEVFESMSIEEFVRRNFKIGEFISTGGFRDINAAITAAGSSIAGDVVEKMLENLRLGRAFVPARPKVYSTTSPCPYVTREFGGKSAAGDFIGTSTKYGYVARGSANGTAVGDWEWDVQERALQGSANKEITVYNVPPGAMVKFYIIADYYWRSTRGYYGGAGWVSEDLGQQDPSAKRTVTSLSVKNSLNEIAPVSITEKDVADRLRSAMSTIAKTNGRYTRMNVKEDPGGTHIIGYWGTSTPFWLPYIEMELIVNSVCVYPTISLGDHTRWW